MTDEARTMVRAARQQAQSLRRAGVRYQTKLIQSAAPAGVAAAPPRETARATSATVTTTPVAAAKDDVDAAAVLKVLSNEVAGCMRCEELARCRTQTVFGVGNPRAALCFVGEAPGADEDRQGEPFVGAAGQLLTKIIGAMGLSRSDVYICNVLKCRPPQNRTPAPDEVANCRGYLDRQLDTIRPRFLCALGGVAAQTLLGTTQGISRLRGKFHDYRGTPLLCTFHPAYLLRNPAAKADVWADVQILMTELGLKRPES